MSASVANRRTVPRCPSSSFNCKSITSFARCLHRKWESAQLDGIVLRHGKFILPISASNDPPSALTFDHIQTELRFQTNDVWTLDNFQANFAGAKFIVVRPGDQCDAVSNGECFTANRGVRGAVTVPIKKIGITLSQIHLNKNSQVSLNVHGDARHLNSFFVFLTVNAPGAQTPWGSAEIWYWSLIQHCPSKPGTARAAPGN